MMRRAVLWNTLAMALATAAGAALCASPAAADDATRVALAPLPEVLAQGKLFPPKSQPMAALKSSAARADRDDKKECREDWRDHRVRLCDLPIGYVLDQGVTFANLIPNHPAGFPADDHSYWFNPVVGIGAGTEVSLNVMGAEALRRPGKATFYGGALQKRILRQSGILPTASVGIRGNLGPHDHDTIASYLVGTWKVWGKPCATRGAYLTGGLQYEHYGTDRNLFNQTPIGRPVPKDSSSGLRPFGALNVALSSRLFVSGEIQKRMPWQWNTPYCVKGTLLVFKDWGVQGGVQNVGYITHGFVGIVFGSIGGASRR